ncbi:MAG: M28 family peptidase [Thermomicrobiales bacterium]|nr:M28 family peptidase [Thermomicrobiales bacterium]MCO5228321.1 M28 family peptidase [Thermomicrobiales bacterium]
MDKAYEQSLIDAVSEELLQEHLNVFSTLFRDSGSEDEWKTARYVLAQLKSYGIDAEIQEFTSLISWPLEGKLAIIDESGAEIEQIAVRTRSFGAQTPAGGVEAELIFVPFAQPEKGAMIFAHRAAAGDYTGLDVRGKVVVTADGGPDGIRRAQERGAIGHIHIWPSDEDVIHEMIGTSVWGTPTPESAKRLPTIPVLGVNNRDGNHIEDLLRNGPVSVRMESNVKTEWMQVPLVTAHIPGTESDDFLLVGAHIDSWYEGVTDNATGDVALIEMARVLNAHKDSLRRGVKFGWWPGHSTGRYSGSTWYADTQFRELRDHSIGYLNIDSPGVRETEIWDCRYNMGEIEHITSTVVHELSGQTPNIRRPLRAGDQSFLGVGLPSMGAYRMLPIDHPDRKAVGGCGGAYWWHSPEDTLDKADARILALDVHIYLTMVARMCTPDVIPYNFIPSAKDFVENLAELQNGHGHHLDLSSVIAAAHAYLDSAQILVDSPIGDSVVLNKGYRRLSQIVNPALFTIDGPYEMDPALQLPVLPGLAPLEKLSGMDPSSSEYQFLLTQLRRQKNRVEDALLSAVDLMRTLIA